MSAIWEDGAWLGKWDEYDGKPGWDAEAETLRLKHSEDDEDGGVHRAYFMDIMDGCPCHQDLQVSDGEDCRERHTTACSGNCPVPMCAGTLPSSLSDRLPFR